MRTQPRAKWLPRLLGLCTTAALLSATSPASASCFTEVAGGNWHSIALGSDGVVYAWGGNTSGQLGDGTTTRRTSPVEVRDLMDVTAISAGYFHNLALRLAERPHGVARRVVADGQDLRGKDRGVLRAGLSDGEATDRDAAWHLRNRHERVDAARRPALHRHAEDRLVGHAREDAREVRRTAGGADEHLHAARRRVHDEVVELTGLPVRADGAAFVRHAEVVEHRARMLHRVPVRG